MSDNESQKLPIQPEKGHKGETSVLCQRYFFVGYAIQIASTYSFKELIHDIPMLNTIISCHL